MESKIERLSYEQLEPKVIIELDTTEIMLSDKLADDPAILAMQIADIEAHHYRVSYLLTLAEGLLSKARYSAVPKEEGLKLNEAGKKLYMEAHTVNEELLRNQLERRLKDIEVRIQVGQSLLAYNREMARLGGRENT